jgi:hypothetical protein
MRDREERSADNSDANEESNQLYAFFDEAQASMREEIRIRAGKHTNSQLDPSIVASGS